MQQNTHRDNRLVAAAISQLYQHYAGTRQPTGARTGIRGLVISGPARGFQILLREARLQPLSSRKRYQRPRSRFHSERTLWSGSSLLLDAHQFR
jgi:hypothetical protein